MLEPEVFRKQMYFIEKVPVTLSGLYGDLRSHPAPSAVIWHPGNCAPPDQARNQGEEVPLEKFPPPWKNVLDIVWND